MTALRRWFDNLIGANDDAALAECTAMTRFAQQLRTVGWQGHTFSPSAVDYILARADSRAVMVAIATEAVRLRKEQGPLDEPNGDGG